MFRVYRTNEYGTGFKHFATKKEVNAFLCSENVKLDMDEGCTFRVVELSSNSAMETEVLVMEPSYNGSIEGFEPSGVGSIPAGSATDS